MPLTVLGLGPGAPELLTLEAHQLLAEAGEVWLRTARHPAVSSLPRHLIVRSFDSLYENCSTFEEVYDAIVRQVWDLAQRPQGVLYAVPGHPLVAEATVTQLLRKSREFGIETRVVSGLSFIEPVLAALEIDPFSRPAGETGEAAPFPGLPGEPAGMQLVDALQCRVDPGRPAIVGQLFSQTVAAQLKLELLELYPPHHPITLISGAGTPQQRILELPLFELDRPHEIDHLTCLYLPALQLTANVATFEGLTGIIARLRAPGGCPWDREQTHASLKPYLIEEAYEALDALERDDLEGLCQELGDLLLNIVLQAQLAAEEEEFTIRDVIRAIAEKLLRRHPHVFGELRADTPEQVVANWEALKAQERDQEASTLSGLARSLPALAYTRSVQERLAPLGLDPADPGAGALGDQLFRLAFQAATERVDPEEALRRANRAYTERVERAEALARSEASTLRDLPPDRRAAIWRQAGDAGD